MFFVLSIETKRVPDSLGYSTGSFRVGKVLVFYEIISTKCWVKRLLRKKCIFSLGHLLQSYTLLLGFSFSANADIRAQLYDSLAQLLLRFEPDIASV